MFGLTDQEMDSYRNFAQNFAVEELTPQVVADSQLLAPVLVKGEKMYPDMPFVNQLVTDLETVITLTTTTMAYDYAHLQAESDLLEDEIIDQLHTKFETFVLNQFIRYGLAFSPEAITRIVSQTILELPYIYAAVMEDDEFNEETFLEERLQAYNDYLDSNFGEDELDEEDEEYFDEEDEEFFDEEDEEEFDK